MEFTDELFEAVNAAIRADNRRREQLNAIAGRNDQSFLNDTLVDEAAEGVLNARLSKRQPFAHLDGRGFMTQSDEDNIHYDQWSIVSSQWSVINHSSNAFAYD